MTEDRPAIEPIAISKGYDRKTCWVQARAGISPGGKAVLTMQKLRLTGSDIFYAINAMFSDDAGKTWTEPVEQEAFRARPFADIPESYFYVSDLSPRWHAASQTMLGTGHSPLYRDDELIRDGYRRSPAYAVCDMETKRWHEWQFLELPANDLFYNCGAGASQRVDLPGGEILLPVYCRPESRPYPMHTVVLRCAFDGETLRYLEHGSSLTINIERGLAEPSLAMCGGRFFLTMRNDRAAYVATSEDGLHFGAAQAWTFDDGKELGSYNTQAHWITHGDALYLVYTRRGANNDHVFRNRAPLFIAQVDTERLCVIRETEQVAVPEYGARIGNFGIAEVNPDEFWVVVSEWMQTTGPDPHDFTKCEKHGADNRVWLSRVRWK